MGTRGAFGFRLDGIDRIAYNHFDSYPSGLGADLLGELADIGGELTEIDYDNIAVRAYHNWERDGKVHGRHEEHWRQAILDTIKDNVRQIVLIDPKIPPTPEQIEECRTFLDLGVGDQSENDWYCLLRNAQGSLSVYMTGDLRYMAPAHGFLADSLFCEYAYIMNLDEGVFEFYKGFNESPDGVGRYASLQSPTGSKNYYGVTLVATIPLDEIFGRSQEEVDELVARLDRREDEDDDFTRSPATIIGNCVSVIMMDEDIDEIEEEIAVSEE